MPRGVAALLGLATAAGGTAPVVTVPPTTASPTTASPTGAPWEVKGLGLKQDENGHLLPDENLTSLPAVLSPEHFRNLLEQEAGQTDEGKNRVQSFFDTLTAMGLGAPHICGVTTDEPTKSPMTEAPVTESPTVSPINVSGDPFTHFRGKSTQFYLPLGKESTLITCSGVELRGEAFGDGSGDTQQWFRAFGVRQDGRELLHAEVRDMSAMTDTGMASFGTGPLAAAATARTRAAQLLADAAAAAAAAERPDVSVAQIVESRVAAALNAMHWAQNVRGGGAGGDGQGKTAKHLTTLNVTVEGRELTHTGAETVGRGASEAFVAVTQDAGTKIGPGFSETVAIGAGGLGVEFTTTVAQKFTGKKSILQTHIDLRFTQLKVEDCTGPLPEIWGTQPMSNTTAVMLFPPKVE